MTVGMQVAVRLLGVVWVRAWCTGWRRHSRLVCHPLLVPPPCCCCCCAAAGLCGILHTLLQAPKELLELDHTRGGGSRGAAAAGAEAAAVPGCVQDVLDTAAALVQACFPSGNLPSSLGSTTDK